MPVPLSGPAPRFLDTTRGQVVALLRRGARTVEELAQALGLTDNAIRSHLATLERDGMARQTGVRRAPGAGKPAQLFALHPDAEPLLSSAYPPVLATLVDVLVAELPPEQADALLRETGRRLARAAGVPTDDDLDARVRAAAAVLTALGGDVVVERSDDALAIRGHGCPLSAAVARRPETCHAVEAMVSELAGTRAEERCDHGDRPRCAFHVARTAAAPA